MYRLQYFLSGILTFIFFVSAVSAQTQKYDPNIACYGDTLDVRLLARNKNGDIVHSVVLNLPYKDKSWAVVLPNKENLKHVDCVTEPIDAQTIGYGGFSSADDNPVGFPKGFRWLSMSALDNLELPMRFLSRQLEEFEASGVKLQDGFLWRGVAQEIARDHAAADGTYLFPGTHRAWNGSRVIRSCSGWVCRSRYPISKNLMVRIEVWNIVPYREWIEHDQEMQRVLKSLIEGQE